MNDSGCMWKWKGKVLGHVGFLRAFRLPPISQTPPPPPALTPVPTRDRYKINKVQFKKRSREKDFWNMITLCNFCHFRKANLKQESWNIQLMFLLSLRCIIPCTLKTIRLVHFKKLKNVQLLTRDDGGKPIVICHMSDSGDLLKLNDCSLNEHQ